jgi:hypothetical protein
LFVEGAADKVELGGATQVRRNRAAYLDSTGRD